MIISQSDHIKSMIDGVLQILCWRQKSIGTRRRSRPELRTCVSYSCFPMSSSISYNACQIKTLYALDNLSIYCPHGYLPTGHQMHESKLPALARRGSHGPQRYKRCQTRAPPLRCSGAERTLLDTTMLT